MNLTTRCLDTLPDTVRSGCRTSNAELRFSPILSAPFPGSVSSIVLSHPPRQVVNSIDDSVISSSGLCEMRLDPIFYQINRMIRYIKQLLGSKEDIVFFLQFYELSDFVGVILLRIKNMTKSYSPNYIKFWKCNLKCGKRKVGENGRYGGVNGMLILKNKVLQDMNLSIIERKFNFIYYLLYVVIFMFFLL